MGRRNADAPRQGLGEAGLVEGNGSFGVMYPGPFVFPRTGEEAYGR